MKSLRDELDEKITAVLSEEVGPDGRFDADGMLNIEAACQIDVGAIVESVLFVLREYAA